MLSLNMPISVQSAVQHFATVPVASPKLVPIEAAIGHRVAEDVRTMKAFSDNAIAKDAVIVPAGDRMTLTSAFACSLCGVTEVMVRKPIVDVIFCAASDIRDQQRLLPIIAAVIRAYGASVGSVQFVMINVADISEALTSSSADIIYLVGGVSPGAGTCAVEAIKSVGTLHFHGVRLRPGGDTAYGTIDGRPVIGMASNVAQMLASNIVLLKPFARRIFGRPLADAPLQQAKLAGPIATSKAETSVIFARLAGEAIMPLGIDPDPLSFAKANSVIVLDEGARRPRPGDRVDFLPLNTIT